ncbi:hypothetical protein [Aquibium microcysteis]|uniref:hypothetical protein n=1 Tax=Aquibium microcysteis TaxID=675281 RepID=UPI00165CF7C0|nr:hypothetical protein [Aquibium microcysteis]
MSANLLCVVVLLLTVSAAGRPPRPASAETGFPIRPGEVVEPAGLVEAFRLRAVRDASIATVDLRRDHVEVKPAGTPPADAVRLSLAAPALASDLRGLVSPAAGGILVFVFAQDGHPTLRRALDAVALPVTEIDVPLALRAPGPDAGWSDAYLALFGRINDPAAFPERLARIIAGGGGTGSPAGEPASASARTDGVSTTLWVTLGAAGRLCFLALSVGAIMLVGRLRPLAGGDPA